MARVVERPALPGGGRVTGGTGRRELGAPGGSDRSVAVKSLWWHETQVVGLPLYTPSAWQSWQGTAKCAPVSGNDVALWLKLAVQVAVVWQVAQVVGKPAARWCGFVAVVKSVWWQATQVVGLPSKTLSA